MRLVKRELFQSNIDFQQKQNGNMPRLVLQNLENTIYTVVERNTHGMANIQEQVNEELKEISWPTSSKVKEIMAELLAGLTMVQI